MKEKLSNIALIQFGMYQKPSTQGDVAYLQAKHFDDLGNQQNSIDTFVDNTPKNQLHLLQEGDILLVGKGLRNFAWTYQAAFGAAIASSIFFVIKPYSKKVIPEFLTTLFNMPKTQAQFQTLGAGSSIPSIRKSELEAFMIDLPPIEQQKKAVAIKALHYKEIALTHRILAEKRKIYEAAIKNIIYR